MVDILRGIGTGLKSVGTGVTEFTRGMAKAQPGAMDRRSRENLQQQAQQERMAQAEKEFNEKTRLRQATEAALKKSQLVAAAKYEYEVAEKTEYFPAMKLAWENYQAALARPAVPVDAPSSAIPQALEEIPQALEETPRALEETPLGAFPEVPPPLSGILAGLKAKGDADKAENDRWVPVAGSGGRRFMREVDGKLEIDDRIFEQKDKDNPVKEYLPNAGFFVLQNGDHKVIPPEFRAMLDVSNRTDVLKVEGNRVWFSDGSFRDVKPPPGSNYDVGKVLDIYNASIKGLLGGTKPTEKALAESQRQLEILGLSDEELHAKEVAWKVDFDFYRMSIPMTAAISEDLQRTTNLSMVADMIMGYLKKPIIRKQMGIIAGNMGKFERWTTGSAYEDPEMNTFVTLMIDMKDLLVARPRSGGAINPDELKMYDDMLGSEVVDPDAVANKLMAIISVENVVRGNIYRTQLQFYKKPFTEEDIESLYYKPINRPTRGSAQYGSGGQGQSIQTVTSAQALALTENLPLEEGEQETVIGEEVKEEEEK
jgi:hypothetical protein